MAIALKLVIVLYCLYILGCFVTGATMQAPYHTLPNTRENAIWRAIEALVALIGTIVVLYWLTKDLVG